MITTILEMNLNNQHSDFHIWNAAHLEDATKWITLWELWPQREIYAHPNYVKLHTDDKTSHAFCACWQSTDTYVLYPFILRDITIEPFWSEEIGSAVDIITPYGYGGPFVWGNGDPQMIAEQFWRHFEDWAIQQNLVSEFIRFTLFRDTLLNYPGKQEEVQQNVVRTLDLDKNLLWMDFKHKVRKNVSRAQHFGVTVELDSTGKRLDDFLHLYEGTMTRRRASDGYYFPRSYFEKIHQTLPGQFIYFHALYNKQVISTELVLVSAENVYSFLGGTDSDSFDLRPNDLLKYEIIHWAQSQGKRRFILGGGYGSEDGIYQYKLSFAPQGKVPFRVGCRTFRPDLSDQLINNRLSLAQSQGFEWTPKAGFFPQYRA
jgi:Acetyltransferase (GNAT) domain